MATAAPAVVKKVWAASRWEIRTASCLIIVIGATGGVISWSLGVPPRDENLMNGQFTSSGVLATDLKAAQTAAIAALKAYAATVTSYATEIGAL